MDTLKFISEIVSSLTWPTVVLILVLILRGEITILLPQIKKLKAGPLEAEFDREVRELALESESQVSLDSVSKMSPEQQKLIQMAELSARSAIIDAWQNVEFAAMRVVQTMYPSIPPRDLYSSSNVLRILNRDEILRRDEVERFIELRNLRNQATHLPEFAPAHDSVLNYINLALQLKSDLDRKISDSTRDNPLLASDC